MAATLPYPSIVFVPLDVLTAEELNQMVQNTAALAALFPIATANLGASAVKSNNIDWTTMKRWVPDYANARSTNIATNNQASVPETGYARVAVYGYSTNSFERIEVSVNNQLVWGMTNEVAGPNGARPIQQTFVIPVSAGDTIKASSPQGALESFAVNMIPGKWV